MKSLELRTAGPDAAGQVALLHADSWRPHDRGAFADSFLDRVAWPDASVVAARGGELG